MFIDEAVKPGEVILIVDDLSLRVLISSKFHEILRLFLAKLDTRCLQMPLHLFDLDVSLVLGVQQSKSCQNCLWLIGLEFLLFQN